MGDVFALMAKFLREPPGGPRSGGEAMSEAKPVRWRPCEAGARPNNGVYYLIDFSYLGVLSALSIHGEQELFV
jgi:hypothetical protein